MLTVDGSAGEGGGQVLRTALTLSACTGKPFRIINIRARRDRPGLRPQHLAAVRAVAEICGASVSGDELSSSALEFAPGLLRPGDYRFDIGTAGSTLLLFQAILPALLIAGGRSRIELTGGTHVPQAPTYEFVARAYLPLIERMGPGVEAELVRPGFYPRGGGQVRFAITPVRKLAPLELETRGPVRSISAEILLCRLPMHIAEREASLLRSRLCLDDGVAVRQTVDSFSPGNVVTVECQCAAATEVAAVVGRRGRRAERVAGEAADAIARYIAADVPVGDHLADQILVPLALAGAGNFVTLEPSSHTRTNINVIEAFLDCHIECRPLRGGEKYRIAFI